MHRDTKRFWNVQISVAVWVLGVFWLFLISLFLSFLIICHFCSLHLFILYDLKQYNFFFLYKMYQVKIIQNNSLGLWEFEPWIDVRQQTHTTGFWESKLWYRKTNIPAYFLLKYRNPLSVCLCLLELGLNRTSWPLKLTFAKGNLTPFKI